MPQKHMECFRLLLEHLAWIDHQFLSGIKDLRKAGRLWGVMRGVGGVRKSIHLRWLAKGLGLGLLCWGFKGVQQEIPLEEVNTLEIGSVAFPPGQCISPQLHPCHGLFDQDHIYPTAPLGQDMTQGQFLSGVLQVWIQSFLSPRLVASPRLKKLVCPTIYP